VYGLGTFVLGQKDPFGQSMHYDEPKGAYWPAAQGKGGLSGEAHWKPRGQILQ